MICTFVFLLIQVFMSNILDPGVPEGEEPFWYQVLASYTRSSHFPTMEI